MMSRAPLAHRPLNGTPPPGRSRMKRPRRIQHHSEAVENIPPQNVTTPRRTGGEAEPEVKTLRRSTRVRKRLDLSKTCLSKGSSRDGLQKFPFDEKTFTNGVSVYDKKHKEEILFVPNYATDIYQRLYNSESKTRPSPYMDGQPDLDSLMRWGLIDWIIANHWRFRLTAETLYLAVNIFDRFLERQQVEKGNLFLVGVTALRIACKYEYQRHPLALEMCVHLTSDLAYTRQDILDMETQIVKTLNYCFTVPTGNSFLGRFLQVCNATRVELCLANFYMDRMLQEHSALRYPPSLVAATAVSLAMNNPDALRYRLSEAPGVPKSLLCYTGFQVKEIKEVATLFEKSVGMVYLTAAGHPLHSAKQKYSTNEFSNVSLYTLPKLSHLGFLYSMPNA